MTPSKNLADAVAAIVDTFAAEHGISHVRSREVMADVLASREAVGFLQYLAWYHLLPTERKPARKP